MKPRQFLASLVAVAALANLHATAAELTTNSTAPTVDGLDIANLVMPTGGQLTWSDRPVQGQTFTTGSEGGTLTAITVQLYEGVDSAPINGWKDYIIRVGTITLGNPNTFAEITSETARQDSDVLPDFYFSFTLDSPITLSPNTLYGFEVGQVGSQAAWQAGIPQVRTSAAVYADGQRFTGGRPDQGIGSTVNLASGDLIFHLEIGTAAPLAPKITSIKAVDAGVFEVRILGEANTRYEFRSSPTLMFDPGTLVENLVQGDPADAGTIGGANGSVLTTDSNGEGTARMTLSGDPADFIRAQTAP